MSVQTQINRIKAARDSIAAKIRARGVSVPTDTKIDELPDFVDDIPSGVELPSLTNEGTAADLLSGKQLIDSDGEVVTGTIPTKTSSNLSASGATVTVPAGYYASQASKVVASGSAKTPATTVTKNPSISVSSSGLITASVSGTQSVTPTVTAGYVSSGTAGTITVSGSATKQLTTQAAQTITPGTSDKTIASGRYLTGTQTIKGDANLVAGNIKSGVSIFGVTGTHEGGGGGGEADTSAIDGLIDRTISRVSSNATAIGDYAFHSCAALTEVDLPMAVSVGNASFRGCTSLTNAYFPSVTTISGSQSFYQCTSLTSINLPALTSDSGSTTFYQCTALTSADLGNCSAIGAGVFNNCSNLKILILRNPTVCSLINRNAFSATPYYSGGTGGEVYVPSALISSYKTATNWSILYGYGTCTFVAIEGSEYE